MTQLIQITDSELSTIVEKAITTAVERMEENKPVEFRYMNVRDTCIYLSITTPTLLSYIKRGLIPAKMINGKYRIKSTDIDDAMEVVKHQKYRRQV
ncbi:MAG: helix-turn-helix domain-containing protein [Flavobacteriales bacterium]|nr:helix-turn-helix domain-containing protein [Flavobacteriales bacterium]